MLPTIACTLSNRVHTPSVTACCLQLQQAELQLRAMHSSSFNDGLISRKYSSCSTTAAAAANEGSPPSSPKQPEAAPAAAPDAAPSGSSTAGGRKVGNSNSFSFESNAVSNTPSRQHSCALLPLATQQQQQGLAAAIVDELPTAFTAVPFNNSAAEEALLAEQQSFARLPTLAGLLCSGTLADAAVVLATLSSVYCACTFRAALVYDVHSASADAY